MWFKIARLILRNRPLIIIAVLGITIFMAMQIKYLRLSYELSSLLPKTDSTYIEYEKFKQIFGEDAAVMIIGVKSDSIFQLKQFNALFDLSEQLKKNKGVEQVLSVSKLFNIVKNDTTKQYDLVPLFAKTPTSQAELDSLKYLTLSLPFYRKNLFNQTANTTLILLTLNKKIIDTPERTPLINGIKQQTLDFAKANNVEVHLSGLPYIRTENMAMVQKEFKWFTIIAFVVTAIVLFLFFKSLNTVVFSILVVLIGVIWLMGSIVLLGYEITLLTALLPPIVIVIGIPNCVYFITRYHQEHSSHGNKITALTRVIQRIGNATLMTNATTAAGFVTFTITGNSVLVEFGVLAAINVMLIFILSLVVIPISYSFLPSPKERHLKHLETKLANNLAKYLTILVRDKRRYIYLTAIIISIIGTIGIFLIEKTGKIAGDIPEKHQIYQDLLFFENNFQGVMPLEIAIDTKKRNGVMQPSLWKKIDELQAILAKYPELSNPISLVEGIKFLNQAFYNGDPNEYKLPSSLDRGFVFSYLNQKQDNKNLLKNFVDSTKQITRISLRMKDIGITEIERIKTDLKPKIDSLFPPEKYDVNITGKSVTFLKGTNYLIDNLLQSVIFAVILIALLMALLFKSYKMVIISLIPNIIPLILTAGIMGYFHIPLKPSTILIFSIALGISVDDTIHFLAKFKQELKLNNWNIKDAVLVTIEYSALSMFYTSVILFSGFSIFIFSNFGGTVALGLLVSLTLLFAMFSNLLILPSLLVSYHHSITKSALNDPLIDIDEDNEEIVEDDKK